MSDDAILALLGAALVAFVALGAWRGVRRGPVRQAASLVGLLGAGVAGTLGGEAVGHALFDGTVVPWLARGVVGTAVVAGLVWLVVFAFLWWHGRTKSASGECDRPVAGAVVGCWTGLVWFCLPLAPVLALAQVGEILSGGERAAGAPIPVRGAMRVRAALAGCPVTHAAAELDLLPGDFRRRLGKAVAVIRSPEAFRRLQNDEEVRALAAHPAFYPLANDPEIKALARRRDARALLTHPRVSELLANDDFQRRLARADLDAMLDRALLVNESPNRGEP